MSEIVTFSGRVTATHDSAGTDAAQVAKFLVSVGERVRNARARKGISRRALSEMSEVSQRYLAQVESGQGNISIGLLLKIAEALNVGIEWLVAKEDPWHSDFGLFSFLIRGATKEQRRRVLEILNPEFQDPRRVNKIALVGLRGAGKSTLGRRAAAALGLQFLEIDEEIEATSGMPVNEIFSLYGQEGYRLLERQCLDKIVSIHDGVVLAVAGGIVSKPDAFNFLLQNFHTIWLRAEPQEHMQRVRAQGDERPMTGNPDAMEDLRGILTSRESLYSRAEAQLSTSNATLDESLAELLRVIERNAFVDESVRTGVADT